MVNRLKEPSTWVGLALLLQVLRDVEVSPDLLAKLAENVLGVISAAGAVLGILLREKAKTPPAP